MEKIISTKYALKLVVTGQAIIEGTVTDNNIQYYIITRLDNQTTVHAVKK